jgi:hypothetical protein
VCFTCGLAIEHPPRLNRLTNGQVCPACRERLLDALPALLPAPKPGTIVAHEDASRLLEARDEWGVDQEQREQG